MRTETGFSILELLGVVMTFGVLAAICAPSITRANRTYRLQSAGRQIVQEVQRAKINAVGRNTAQTLAFNTTNRTLTVSGTTLTLPDGIAFAALPSNIAAPPLVQQATQNAAALPSQQSDAHAALSLSATANTYTLAINAKGLPAVEPGEVNWLYLTNADGQRVAITITSAGSVALLTLGENGWR